MKHFTWYFLQGILVLFGKKGLRMNITDIGELVREARRDQRMTQVELAEKSGVSRVRINRLECGEVFDMTFSNVMSLLEALDLSLRIGTANAGRPVFEELQEQKDDLYDTPGLG